MLGEIRAAVILYKNLTIILVDITYYAIQS